MEKRNVGRPKSGNYRKSYWANPETHDKIQQLVVESNFINQVQSANLSKCEKEALKSKKNMITAQDFLLNEGCGSERDKNGGLWFYNVRELDLISFAELHVEEALKNASENVKLKLKENFENLDIMDDCFEIDKDSILNSYPLENIK